jgi:hypothetical protein
MSMVDTSKISKEEWQAMEKELFIEAYQAVITALVDEGGSESALNEFRSVMRMSGRAFSINMNKLFEIQGSDLERISDLCILFEKFYSNDMNEIERTPDRIARAGGTRCLWQGNLKEGCIGGHEMFLNGVCEDINPQYQCRFTRMITKGDPLCSYVIEKKKK